jgi:hypothetical protein
MPRNRKARTSVVRGRTRKFLEELTPAQRARRAELEAVIEHGLKTFIEVGAALEEMRVSGLYRETHTSWKAYLRQRWGYSPSRARQLIAGRGRATALAQGGLPAPPNERVVRELNRLRDQPELQQAAWQQAVAEYGPKPTVEQVRRIVYQIVTYAPDPVEAATVGAEEEAQLWEKLKEIPREQIRQMRQILDWCVELKAHGGNPPPSLPLRVRRCITALADGWTRSLKETGLVYGLTGPDNRPIGREWPTLGTGGGVYALTDLPIGASWWSSVRKPGDYVAWVS